MRSLGLIRNFLYLSGAEVASKLATLLAITYLARVAGPVGFGYVEFAGAVLLCAGLIVDQGFGTYGAREIARDPARTEALVAEIVTARFALALIAYAVVVLFALALGRSEILTWLLVIYGMSLLTTPLLLQWVFQGHDQMQRVAITQVIRQIVYAVIVFGLVRDASRIWGAAVAEIAGASAAAAYGIWLYRHDFRGRFRVKLSISRRLFIEGIPIGLSQMLWMIRMFGATVIVGIIATPEDVGYFGGAMRILIALHAFVWLYYFNLLPSLSKAWQNGPGAFATLVAESLHGVAWIVVVGGLVWVWAAPTVTTLVFGAAFAPGSVPLQWLAGVCVAAGISGHYRFGLIAAGQQTAEMVISAVGAVAAVVTIPAGYVQAGPGGAAVGLFVTELVVWWSAWWWARRRLGLDGHVRLLARPVFAMALALTVLGVLPLPSPVLQIGVGVTMVVAIALLLDASARDQGRRLARVCYPIIWRQLRKRVNEVA